MKSKHPFRLSALHKRFFYSSFAVLFLSGVIWAGLHFFVRTEGDFGPEIHPAEPLALKLHGAAAMIGGILFGTLLPSHIKRAWQAKRNRLTGLAFIAVNVVLMLSGYALYYLGVIRDLVSWVHLSLGLAFPFILVWHIWQGRREAQAPQATHARPRRVFHSSHGEHPAPDLALPVLD